MYVVHKRMKFVNSLMFNKQSDVWNGSKNARAVCWGDRVPGVKLKLMSDNVNRCRFVEAVMAVMPLIGQHHYWFLCNGAAP